jgi:DNA modification methylase
MNEPKVRKVKISELIPDANNANLGTERGRYMLEKSIQDLGFGRSLVLDKHGRIIAGNKSHEVAGAVGLSDVLVIETDGTQIIAVQRTDLDLEEDEKAKLLAVVDNRTSEISLNWDAEILLELDKEIDLSGFFTDDELNQLSLSLNDEEEGSGGSSGGDNDTIPEVVESRVATGDIWQLGRHFICAADCTVEENVRKLLSYVGGRSPDMVWADPPYNCADEMSESFYAATNSGAMKKLSKAEWDKGFDIQKFLDCLDKFRPKNGTIYICTSHILSGAIWKWMAKDSTHNSYCVWAKPNPMPSLAKRHWTWATELICYATYGKHVFNFPGEGHALSWWQINTNSANTLHPTQKPVELVAKAIERSSIKSALIYDPFLGSAPSVIACEQLEGDRTVVGFELSETYCEVICQRFQSLTSVTPVKVGNINTFNVQPSLQVDTLDIPESLGF